MVTIESDGFTVETNTDTADAIQANLATVAPAEETHAEHLDSQSGSVGDEGSHAGDGGEVHGRDGSDDDGSSADAQTEQSATSRKPKPRENIQARLSQLTEQRKAEKERADRLEAELRDLRQARQAPVEAKVEPQKETGKPELKRVDYPAHLKTFDAFLGAFPDAQYEDYTDARAEHRIGLVQAPDVSSVVQQELARVTKDAQHMERARQAAEKYADYGEALNIADAAMATAGVALSPTVIEAIKSSSKGGEVLYYLGTHPDECVQLARETNGLPVSAASLVRSLLEARLGAGVTPGAALTPHTSKAKPPIKPVGASPVASPVEDADDEPLEQYVARANARDRKAGRL